MTLITWYVVNWFLKYVATGLVFELVDIMILGMSVLTCFLLLEGLLILSFVGMSTLTFMGLEGMLILSCVSISTLSDWW